MFKEELIIVRHGRSEHNVKKSNNLDSSLTKFGLKQAKNVGDFLKNHFPLLGTFRLYTSPFLRCLETAKNMEIHSEFSRWNVDAGFREYINLDAEKIVIPNRISDTRDFAVWPDHKKNYEYVFEKESNEIFFHRISQAYDGLPQKSVVVTHGMPVAMLAKIATGSDSTVPIWTYSFDNCSITYINRGRTVWSGRNLHHEQ